MRRLYILIFGLLLSYVSLGQQKLSWNYFYAVADSLQESEQYKSANHYIDSALITLQNNKDVSDTIYAKLILKKGLLKSQQGDYLEAEEYLLRALEIIEKNAGNHSLAFATALHTTARHYYYIQNYPKSIELHRQALNIRKAILGQKSIPYAESLNDLALVYEVTGRVSIAVTNYQISLFHYKALLGENHKSYATVLMNYTRAKSIIGNYAGLKYNYEKVLQIYKETIGSDNLSYANGLLHLSSSYQTLNPKYCIQLRQEALKIRQRILGSNHPKSINALQNIASVYRQTKQYSKAIAILDSALQEIEQKLPNFQDTHSRLLHAKASIYYDMKQYHKVIDIIEAVRSKYGKQALYSIKDYSTLLHTLGLSYEKTGQIRKAHQILHESLLMKFDYINDNIRGTSEHDLFGFLSGTQRDVEFYYNFVIHNYNENPDFAGKLYDIMILFKSIQLKNNTSIRESITRLNDREIKYIYDKWLSARQAYVDKLMRSSKRYDYRYTDSLLQICKSYERSLSARVRGFKMQSDLNTIGWRALQKLLSENESIVEISAFTSRNTDGKFLPSKTYIALTLSKNDTIPQMILLSKDSIFEKMNQRIYKNNINTRGVNVEEDAQDSSSIDLYKAIWKPIEMALPKKCKKIYFVPDGIYHYFNLYTIQDSAKQYLIDYLNIIQLTSSSDLLKYQETSPAKPTNAALFGFPDYSANISDLRGYYSNKLLGDNEYSEMNDVMDSTGHKIIISPLPGTYLELESVDKILISGKIKTEKYIGKAASESNLNQLKSIPDILHIATHGFFYENSHKGNLYQNVGMTAVVSNPYLRCGLYLAGAEKTLNGINGAISSKEDGVLTAYEITSLPVQGTQIVVLSACETGLGSIKNGEGIFGLQRALIEAGAKSVLFSLWKVSDEATNELMTLFYTNWIIKGMTKRDALRTAQIALRNYPEYSSPFFWGAFVLIGE